MDPITETAPAQPITETPIASAVDAAVSTNDMGAFKEAKAAERAGKPLPAPELSDDDAIEPTAAAPVVVSKRQQAINDKIREAVERATGEANAELTRLRALVQPSDTPAPAPARPEQPKSASAPVADPEPDASNSEKYPGGEYDPKFLRDLALWSGKEAVRAEKAIQAEQHAKETRAQAIDTRVKTFRDRADLARKADPHIFDHLAPAIAAMQPSTDVEAKDVGPQHVLADQIFESEVGPQALRYLSDHPDDLQTILSAPSPMAVVRAFAKLETRLTASAPDGPKTISDAPDPPRTLGSRASDASDPITSAVRSNDMTAFKEAKLRQRLAAKR